MSLSKITRLAYPIYDDYKTKRFTDNVVLIKRSADVQCYLLFKITIHNISPDISYQWASAIQIY